MENNKTKLPITRIFMLIGFFSLLKFVNILAKAAGLTKNPGSWAGDSEYLNMIVWVLVMGVCLIIAVISVAAKEQKYPESRRTVSVKELFIISIAIIIVYLSSYWAWTDFEERNEFWKTFSSTVIYVATAIVPLLWHNELQKKSAQTVSPTPSVSKEDSIPQQPKKEQASQLPGRRKWKFQHPSDCSKRV